MQYTRFPNSELAPSVICLGTGAYGSDISEEDSFALLDAFAEAGGNFTDSAHIYAAWRPDGVGQSERTLGRWINSRRPRNFLVGTKGGHPHLDSMHESRLSPECISQDLAESLERLSLDSIDMYWLHRDDPQIPVGEIMDVLNQHLAAGRIRATGASNWTPSRISEANEHAALRSCVGFCASQVGWSLAEINSSAGGVGGTLHMDDETLGWHEATGFPVAAFSSQANGFFAHSIPAPGEAETPKQKSLATSYSSPRNQTRHQRVEELAGRLGHSPNSVALAYLWSQSFPAVAIVGPRNLAQLRDSLSGCDLRLSTDDVQFLAD